MRISALDVQGGLPLPGKCTTQMDSTIIRSCGKGLAIRWNFNGRPIILYLMLQFLRDTMECSSIILRQGRAESSPETP